MTKEELGIPPVTQLINNALIWDFPVSPVGKISPSNASDVSLIPGWGANIPHVLWP